MGDASYKFVVMYEPGKTNIADPLSRLLGETETQLDTEYRTEEYVRWIVSHAEPKALKTGEIAINGRNQ